MTTDDTALAAVGPRLRQIRQRNGATLADLAERTGISVSTLSRLESGKRKPSLELLLPIARAHNVPLDELVTTRTEDPRVHGKPIRHPHGHVMVPLTRQPGALQAFKITTPPGPGVPDPRVHEGYEWLYVLSGKLRMILGEHDLVLTAGEAVEFDTRLPHWFGAATRRPAEFLSLFGPQGQRMHVAAKSYPKN